MSAHDTEAVDQPFDTMWHGLEDIDKGYDRIGRFYRVNLLPLLPPDRDSSIVVVSCGPGYLVNMLKEAGYERAYGIDADPAKIEHGVRRGIDLRVAHAFDFLGGEGELFDAIICEQDINHLTLEESIRWLDLCRARLNPGGVVTLFALNGANPITAMSNLAGSIDHTGLFTEYSLKQLFEAGGFSESEARPARYYVFWSDPRNYIALAATECIALLLRVIFLLYGKKNRIWTKKMFGVGRKPRS